MLEQHLANLLIKLAVAAAVASILVRSDVLKRALLRDSRTLIQRVQLALGFAAIFGGGVATRVFTGVYKAVDLGLEGSLLAGILGGYVSGLLAGILISLPAMLFTGEYLSMPRWTGLYLFGAEGIFALYAPGESRASVLFAVFTSTLFAVTLPLKVWNNTRTEDKLEAQQRLLNEARLAALTRQINPHFLFNTLNSISSLIRTDQEQARTMIYRLSSILRSLLKKRENLTSLREEMQFIDDYMGIELVRFGSKLRFLKDIDAATVDRLVPSMLLQPLVENSIKHGLSSKVDGGMIRIRSRLEAGRLFLLVEDDGVGIPEAKLATLFEQGIGISNVNERLKVLFGDGYRMVIDSRPGHGTQTEIELPELKSYMAAVS
jgi:two-component system LytT family sensor kinase